MNCKKYSCGLQHIGLPTADFDKTIAFYEALGFEQGYATVNGGNRVCFEQLGNLSLEIYESDCVAGKIGAIDHISLNVSDVDALFAQAKAEGLTLLDEQVQFLPFWKNGVRFFTILGPNQEKLEFNQYL